MRFNWKTAWSVRAARVDGLSLRERGALFVVFIFCSASLANMFWLSPAQETHQQLTLLFSKQSADLQRAREELKSTVKPVDTSSTVREEIIRVKEQLKVVNQAVEADLPEEAHGKALAQVLVYFLHRHPGLTLVSTVALAPIADAGSVAASGSSAAVPMVFMRQGVVLTVSGAYPDLMRYVQALEQELPHVRWGVMKLQADKLPPELTLQLFLLGVKP